jgi:hypothetical protein
MNIIRGFLSVSLIFWISNCGGEAGVSLVSITPTEPFILSVDRSFFIGEQLVTFSKPNITFQLRVDNRGNGAPLTIIGLTLDVNGPKGRKIIPIDSASNLFRFTGQELVPTSRAFFTEVRPYQASFCMDKVNYLREVNYDRTCLQLATPAINDPKIQEFGVSAFDTEEGPGGFSCCPNASADLTNIVIVAGGLQDYAQEEIIPQSQTYTINASVVGFFGTFLEPVANFNTQVFFNARSN